MDRKRKVYAPFSQTSEAGVAQTPVEGYIGVNQTIYPSVDTGVIDEKGIWRGVKSSDEDFFGITKHVNIPDGEATVSPATSSRDFIDMTGFNDLMLAVKVSNAGNYEIQAVMGPDTNRFANLSPVLAGAILRGTMAQNAPSDFEPLFNDGAEAIVDGAWNIYIIGSTLRGQKNMQIKITNNSGGNSTIEVAFMRLI